ICSSQGCSEHTQQDGRYRHNSESPWIPCAPEHIDMSLASRIANLPGRLAHQSEPNVAGNSPLTPAAVVKPFANSTQFALGYDATVRFSLNIETSISSATTDAR
ncbi:hypothetical protein IAQ61_009886, partial [Plenodomus lingam]|uniref:uncharacterized protein n=1 Tax=Leptosphaeria maculans TaxID=5022 RepID=UPI00331BE01A